MLPVGMYEGTGLSINTDAEALALATALVADLSYPTADFAIQVKPYGFEIEDVLRLEADPKGRWGPGVLDTAVVAVEEDSASGRCTTTLELRAQAPTAGVGWGSRIAVSPTRPAPLDNYPIRRDSDVWKLHDAARSARGFNLVRRDIARHEMGRRHDSTLVWLGDSVDFAPTPDKLVGKFRSNNMEITHVGNGSALTPGATYFVKTAEQDLWGNLGQINGVGAASASTVPSFVTRFLDESAGAFAVGVSGATFEIQNENWVVDTSVTVDDGSDAAGLSYDTFSNYSTSSRAFQAPCAGTYQCTHRVTLYGGPSKVGALTPWDAYARFAHHRAGTLLGTYGTDGVSGVGNVTPEDLAIAASITCRSGDWIRAEVRANVTTDAYTASEATSTAAYTATTFALVNQR